MPDKFSIPLLGYKCPTCASASVDCLPAFREDCSRSQREICCLYKAAQQGQPAYYLKKASQQRSNGDLLCKDMAASVRTCLQSLVQGSTHQLLPENNFVPENAGASNLQSSSVARRARRKCAKIQPRMRPGFTKHTIEVRPPGFKKKLWFGTYEERELDRAIDAINFYMENEEPYKFPDSPQIFSSIPLDIRYKDLLPSCEEFVFVGEKRVRKSAQFAKLVKAAINRVTGKQKAKRSKKFKKPKLDLCAPALLPTSSSTTAVSAVTTLCDTPSSSTSKPCAFDAISSSIGPTAGSASSSSDKWFDDVARHQNSVAANSHPASLDSLFDSLPPIEDVWEGLEPLSTDDIQSGMMGDDGSFGCCWK
uniref:Uncharacterized protein n=1 Tax=Physcomitrium patens TaxID=3218 RepID=A0A2K1JRI2_PHYPA|nr:hypothetical protein PHYPA_016528 [Physcomitrium patens]